MKKVWQSILSFFGYNKNEAIKSKTKKGVKDENVTYFDAPLYWGNLTTPTVISADDICDFGEKYADEKLFTRSKPWNRENYTLYSDAKRQTIEVTLKEDFMLMHLSFNSQETDGKGWMTSTTLGRLYGKTIKKRNDYNAGHSRNCLLRLVKMKLVVVNNKGQFQIAK